MRPDRPGSPPPTTALARAGAVLVMLGAGLAAGVLGAAPAQAAAANCEDTLYVADAGSDNILEVSLAGQVRGVAYVATPDGGSLPNQLGIGAAGAYAINSATNAAGAGVIVERDLVNNTTTTVPRPAGGVNSFVGAVNPENGLFYYGGYSSGRALLSAYDPTTNTALGQVASVTVETPPGDNGDIAFGSDGTLYLVASGTGGTRLYRLQADLPTRASSATYAAELLTTTSSASANGIAFASDGYLYLGTSTTLQRVNPINGALAGGVISFSSPVTARDLGTCAGPNTIEAGVTLPDNRLRDADQFLTTVTGGSYTNPPTFPSGTTTGTDSGPQTAPAETAGPGIVLPGETYTLSVTGAPGTGTNINDYAVSYTCTSTYGGEPRTETGTSVTITPVEGVGAAETCTFTVQNPVSLTKTVEPATFDSVGDQLTYTFVATNDDSVALTDFQLIDPMFGTDPLLCTPYAEGTTLPAGATTTCTATYTITQADVQGGSTKTNTATMTTDPRPEATRTSSAASSVDAANNAVPVEATPDTRGTPFRTPVTLPASRNDDAGTSDIVFGSTVFTAGAATLDGKRLVTDEGTWEVLSEGDLAGQVRFTPDDDFTGETAAVTYRVTDANGFTDTATLVVTVRTGPSAAPDTPSTPQNTTLTFRPSANDTPGPQGDGSPGSFVNATLRFAAVEGQQGTLSEDRLTLTMPGEGVYTIEPDTGTVTFDPAATFADEATPVIYQVADQAGNTVTGTVTVTVRPITPVATDDSVTTAYQPTVTLPGASNDSPGTDDNGTPDDTGDDVSPELARGATVFPDAQPAGASVSEDRKTLSITGQGTWVIQRDGSVVFTPAEGFSGTTASVVYQVQDVNGSTDTATLTVTLRAAPVAVRDDAATAHDVTVVVPVLGNDTPGVEVDGDPGTWVLGSVRFPVGGQPLGSVPSPDGTTLVVAGQGTYTVNEDGTVTFDPLPGFSGAAAAVTYAVTDSSGGTATASLVVTVGTAPAPPNHAPVAVNDSASTTVGTGVTIAVLGNDTDPDGNALTVTGVGTPAHGTAVLQPNGTVTYTPNPGYTGTDSFTYTVSDGRGGTSTATVTVTIAAPDRDDSSDVVLDKRVVSGAQVTVGGTVRYRLQVANKGTAAAAGPIRLTDPLPDGLELRSAHGKGWTCTVRKAADKVTCVRSRALGVDRKAPPVFVVAVATRAAMGRVVNVAHVDVAGEAASSRNRDRASITVVPAQLPSTGFRAMPPGA